MDIEPQMEEKRKFVDNVNNSHLALGLNASLKDDLGKQ
jgi:hypothetical protein